MLAIPRRPYGPSVSGETVKNNVRQPIRHLFVSTPFCLFEDGGINLSAMTEVEKRKRGCTGTPHQKYF